MSRYTAAICVNRFDLNIMSNAKHLRTFLFLKIAGFLIAVKYDQPICIEDTGFNRPSDILKMLMMNNSVNDEYRDFLYRYPINIVDNELEGLLDLSLGGLDPNDDSELRIDFVLDVGEVLVFTVYRKDF